MSKLQVIALSGAALVLIVGIVIRAKRISPLGWGWYGAIQATDGLALHGYDPVAYLAAGATLGDAVHSVDWLGAKWRFVNAANKAAFEADPVRYAPEFGGFCAYASSKGFTATIDPTAFKVYEGKLYVFNDASMRDKWLAELPSGVIVRAQEHWKARSAR